MTQSRAQSPSDGTLSITPLERTLANKPAQFPYFCKLAPEIQDMIWEAAIEEEVVHAFSCDPRCTRAPTRTWFKYDQAVTISAVFLPNPDLGTIIIPAPSADTEFYAPMDGVIQEVKKLIVLDTGFNCLARDVTRLMPYHPPEPFSPLPGLMREALEQEEAPIDLRGLPYHFPNIKELTHISRAADWSWWMGDEYRVHGPDVVSRPAENCRWHEDGTEWRDEYLYGDLAEKGFDYYEKMGIFDDAGITWPFVCDYGELTPFLRCAWHRGFHTLGFKNWPPLIPNATNKFHVCLTGRLEESSSAPKIGFRGFSYNSTSCGGMWAGFRLYLGDDPRLEFSPLAWEDVKDDMYSYRIYEPRMGSLGSHGVTDLDDESVPAEDYTFPECIIKITIIRPGDKAPPSSPHHCWEPVVGDFKSGNDFNGVDWRPRVDIGPEYPSWDNKKYFRPKFDREQPLSEQEERELKFLNRFRIRSLFRLAALRL